MAFLAFRACRDNCRLMEAMVKLLPLRETSRWFALLLAALLVMTAAPATQPALGQNAPRTVRLTIDYGDGITKTISNLDWAKGNTVLDAMKAATARSHGISFGFTSSGATAVLTKIDDVQNEGGGAGKKNWQYWVDGAYGDRSFATFELQAGAVIVWRFEAETEQDK